MIVFQIYSECLDSAFSHVYVLCLFFFFFARVNSNLTWVHCSRTVWYCLCTIQHCSCTVHVLKNIKNGSHDTIYTIKNYFATVFSVFSNNKLNPNGPFVSFLIFKDKPRASFLYLYITVLFRLGILMLMLPTHIPFYLCTKLGFLEV